MHFCNSSFQTILQKATLLRGKQIGFEKNVKGINTVFHIKRFTEYKWYAKKTANSMQGNMCNCRRQQEFGSRGLHVWQIKIQVKLSLCLIKHYPMKAYGGMEIQVPALVNLALVEGKWSTSRSSRFTSRARAGKPLAPAWNWTIIPSHPAHSIVTILTTLSRLPLYMAVNVLMDEEWSCLHGCLSQHRRPPSLLQL